MSLLGIILLVIVILSIFPAVGYGPVAYPATWGAYGGYGITGVLVLVLVILLITGRL